MSRSTAGKAGGGDSHRCRQARGRAERIGAPVNARVAGLRGYLDLLEPQD